MVPAEHSQTVLEVEDAPGVEAGDSDSEDGK